MIGIVVSDPDEASVLIWEQLRELVSWRREETSMGGGNDAPVYRHEDLAVRRFDELHLHLDRPAAAFDDPELVVFVSRHAGETGRLLSTHYPGNFGEAAYGGAPGELPAPATWALPRVYGALSAHAPPAYEVGIECTHHGPSAVGAPTLFVELGSDEAAWTDPGGAEAVARAVLSLSDTTSGNGRTVIGVGGGHYAPKFERILRETDWSVGHIAADWALSEIGAPGDQADRISTAMALSDTEIAVVDGEYPALIEELTARGARIVTETWVQETDGVPNAIIQTVEDRLGPVTSGTRFGNQVDVPSAQLVARELTTALLDEWQGRDRDRTRQIVDRHSTAYTTTEAGNRVGTELLLPSARAFEALIDDGIAMLADHYPSVSREAGVVVVREERFDPAAASAMGIPEGPLFGKLADGQPVEYEGETVDPETVTEVEERRIPTRND